jgi:hypothetical protein
MPSILELIKNPFYALLVTIVYTIVDTLVKQGFLFFSLIVRRTEGTLRGKIAPISPKFVKIKPKMNNFNFDKGVKNSYNNTMESNKMNKISSLKAAANYSRNTPPPPIRSVSFSPAYRAVFNICGL